MNRNRYLIALLAVFAMIIAGCGSEEDVIENGDPGGTEEFGCKLLNNREIDRTGGTFYWAVKASEAWTLDADSLADWLTIEPSEGKAGTTAVTLVFAELPDDKERAMELPFVLGEKEVKITVKQTLEGGKEEAEGPLCRFTENAAFGKSGGSLICTLETSADWTLSENVDWLTVSPMEGKAGKTKLTLTAEASGSILRMALLPFTLDGEIVELFIGQTLNDFVPTLTLSQEVELAGSEATMHGHCAFENDEMALEEVGFAYKVEGADNSSWIHLPSESAITNGEFDFTAVARLSWGTTYVYKPYAKLNKKIYEGEETTFTIENRVVEDEVWYYENFDGMYNPETKVYSATAQNKNYDFRVLDEFDTNGGFLRKNQPAAKYEIPNFRLTITSGSNDAYPSAVIHPDGFYSWWTGKYPAETQLYTGASGNWKSVARYTKDWNFTVTGLDFSGASDLQLTFGCFYWPTSKIQLPDGVLKVFVSADGKDWNEVAYSYNTLLTKEKYWRHIVVDDFPSTTTAIRILLNDSAQILALDDIKVMTRP